MRIGVMIGPERGRYATKVDRLRRDAAWAEEAGFSTIWIPQIPDEFDALTAAAVIGAATERIEIGTAVVPIQPRHPIALAQQALSVQAVCGGRLRLGLGVSHHWIIDEMLGLPYEGLLGEMRDQLEVLEPALAQRPGRVDLAVEVPLPDAAGRRRLFRLYAADQPFGADALDAAADATDGMTASFVKEAIRRAVLLAAEAGHPVGDDDLADAVREMTGDSERITRSLLGVTAAGGPPD